MTDSIRVTLPIPPKPLHPNARPHYMTKAKATKGYRVEAWLMAGKAIPKDARPPRWKSATVRVRWFSKTKRRPDADNALASLKAAFDGLTDAGVWTDDRAATFMPIEFGVDKSNPRVEVEIQEAKAEA